MKPNNVIESVREGDLGGDKIQMGIDANSFAHIMTILTDLYSDPELAVIREYSTNARDSHIEAGCPDRPIEVTTPTQIFPYFRVKDYGVGMDHDTIADVYSKYGASTKRGGNDQTGMLGLGGKSALTYTSQFTVVGIKNGVKTTVVVSRNDDGGGVMQVVDTCATDEENGVEITIPARRGDFGIKVPNFFRFWPAGSVLINGKPNEAVEVKMVNDRTGWRRSTDRQDYVVMGGVAYPVATGHMWNYGRSYNIVMFVDMGEVNFTPSREELHYTSLTKSTLARYYKDFADSFAAVAHAEVEAAADRGQAWRLAATWRTQFGARLFNFKYQGSEVPNQVQVDKAWVLTLNRYGRTKYNVFRKPSVDYTLLDNTNGAYVFIHNYDDSELTVGRRRKIEGYLRSQNLRWQTVYLHTEDWTAEEWLSDIQNHSIDWSAIKDFKIPRTTTGGTTPKSDPTYSVFTPSAGKTDMLKSEIDALVASDPNCKVLYFAPGDVRLGYRESKDAASIAHNTAYELSNLGVVVALIGSNRHDKFVRDFPKAMKADKWIRDYIADKEKALSDGEKMAIALKDSYYGIGEKFATIRKYKDQIDDPKIVEIATAVATPLSTYATNRAKIYKVGYRLNVCSERAPHFDVDAYIEKNYPLANWDTGRNNHLSDTILYVNAKYAAIKKGGK